MYEDYSMIMKWDYFKVSCGRLHPGENFMNDDEMGWNLRLAVVGCTFKMNGNITNWRAT